MNLNFDILELYFAKKVMVILMFKIRVIFLDVSRILKKNAVSELIKLFQLVMTLGKPIIGKHRFIIYKKTMKIYSLGNACPLARMHCLDTIASKESWIVRCSRLQHAVIIEIRSSSKLCDC